MFVTCCYTIALAKEDLKMTDQQKFFKKIENFT